MEPSEQVCITQDPATALTGTCSQQEPYDNSQACIAVYFLKTYNIPLFAAFRIRATTNRPLNVYQRIYRDDCENYSGGWQYKAFSTNGVKRIRCNTEEDSWKFNFYQTRGVYNRGHLVPCSLGKLIGLAMGAATFNIYNAEPQLKETNTALERLEANLIEYATETCLNTAVVTGNVVRDFYFISGSVPDITSSKKRWINRGGVWSWKFNFAPSLGSNVPAIVWTAGCCLLTFPNHHNKQFAVRISCFIKNEPGERGKYTDIFDLKKDMNLLYTTLFNKWVVTHNIFGGGACDKRYSYREISDILIRHYKSEISNL